MSRTWTKLVLIATLLGIPATVYAYQQMGAGDSCPTTSDCPCD